MMLDDSCEILNGVSHCDCVLVGVHAGMVVSAEKAGERPLAAVRESFGGDWERFSLLKNDDESFALRSAANRKYVSAIPAPHGDGHLIAAGGQVKSWEKFELVAQPDSRTTFALRARSTGKFVSVDETRGNMLVADRDCVGEWEKIKVLTAFDSVGLLVDVGGSGVKIRRLIGDVPVGGTHKFRPESREAFYECLRTMAKDAHGRVLPIAGIAVSLAGEYDYVNERAISCYHWPFLVGELRKDLMGVFACQNVHIVNDGDAHLLALKALFARDRGVNLTQAINMSLGTAVGFGVLDCKGELLHTCQGHNWEVSGWHCDTTAKVDEMYWALGSEGLREMESKHPGRDAYVYYGQRLCHFLSRDLVPLFRPRTIGLSGGIAAAHREEILEGIERECQMKNLRSQGVLDGVEICVLAERDTVMTGLAGMLSRTC